LWSPLRQLGKCYKTGLNRLDPHIELAAAYLKLHRSEDGLRKRAIMQRIEAEQPKQGPPKQ
jgi:hypothetical protein